MMKSILYFLLWAGFFVVMMRFGCGAHVMGHGHRRPDSRPDGQDRSSGGAGGWAPPEEDVDPVCHMTVDTDIAKTAVYGGHVYHFCSQDCRGKFEENPRAYLKPTTEAQAAKEHRHAC